MPNNKSTIYTRLADYTSTENTQKKNNEKFGSFSISAAVRLPYDPSYYHVPGYDQPYVTGVS